MKDEARRMEKRIIKKFLTVCAGGTVRSTALAHVLKYEFSQEAVPLSFDKLSQESLDFMAPWADYIVVMQPKFKHKFEKWIEKVRVLDVGEDRWMNPLHPELVLIVSEIAEGWRKNNWRL
jgi:galactitol-specific phosphotransferase system IIB component